MDFQEKIRTGMSQEELFQVDPDKTAIHIGSGASRVLATPWMIAFMERLSHRLLAGCLPRGYSSVGVRVDVRHLAPTPVGISVRVRTEVLQVEGAKVTFKVEAWDDTEKVGEGTHERFIIEEARFLKRVAAKGPGEAA